MHVITDFAIIYTRMECQLAEYARRYSIPHRWSRSDADYIAAFRAYLDEKISQLHSCLWAVIVKRHYLLKMKAKYAGTYIRACITYYEPI